MIATYRGIIRDGKVELQGVKLPEGAEVIVVAEAYLTLQEQGERYASLSDEKWGEPFAAYRALSIKESGEVQEEDLTDEALTAVVHESRAT
jgi:hypothetical protein